MHLEAHAVRVLMGAQSKVRLQVFADEQSLVGLLDRALHQLVDGNLIRLALLRRCVLLFLLREDVAFGLAGFLLVRALEVSVVDVFGNGDTLQVHARLRGDDVALGDATQWAAVQVERSVDEEQAGLEDLQQHNALSLMTAGQQDEHLAGHQCAASVAGVLLEVVAGRALCDLRFGGVRSAVLVDADDARFAVLGSTDLLLDGDADLRWCFLRCLGGLGGRLDLLQAVRVLLADLEARPAGHSTSQVAVFDCFDNLLAFGCLLRCSRCHCNCSDFTGLK